MERGNEESQCETEENAPEGGTRKRRPEVPRGTAAEEGGEDEEGEEKGPGEGGCSEVNIKLGQRVREERARRRNGPDAT